MREIQLTKGYVAIVDDYDYEWAKSLTWCASVKETGVYAKTTPKSLYLHRMVCGAKDGDIVDHINGDTLLNTEANLRVCRKRDNQRNQRAQTGVTSTYKGVYCYKIAVAAKDKEKIDWLKVRSRWRANIKVNGKNIYLGNFTNETDAAMAYDRAAIKYFGEFARTNFPQTKENQCQPSQ